VVAYGCLGRAVQIDIAEDAAHAEHVLAFQIRAVAPAEHLYGQAVASGAQVACQVKFCHVVRPLCVAYVLSVQVDKGRAVDTAEMDKRALPFPTFGQVEEADVGAYGIDAIVFAVVIEFGAGVDVGRRVIVWIFHVGVDGVVIPLHFPVGGNGNLVPAAYVVVFFVEVERTLRRFRYQVERPFAVQQEIS